MAVDTAEKRRSLSGIQVTLIPGVTPNASKDKEWRQQACWGYSGILAQTLTAVQGRIRTLKMDVAVRVLKMDVAVRTLKRDILTRIFKVD